MRRLFRVLAALAFLIGLWSQAQAQVPMTGAGLGAPATGGGGEATVLIDQTQVSQASNSTTTSAIFSSTGTLNAGAGPNGTANMVLTAALQFCNATAGTSVPTLVQWDAAGTPQTMTKLTWAGGTTDHIGNGSAGDIYYYYLLNPHLGNLNLSITWTGTNQVVASQATFVNVDQTGGNTTFPTVVGQTGVSSVPTVTISTSPTTRKITGAFNSGTNFTTTGSTAYTGSPNNSCTTAATGAAWDVGSISSMSYSPSGGPWAALGVVIKGN